MIYGIEASETPAPAGSPAIRFDNTSSSNGIIQASQGAANSPLLTISMWLKFADLNFQYQIVSFSSFDDYVGAKVIHSNDIVISLNDSAFTKYYQLGTAAGTITLGTWNHLFISVDLNHAAGAKLGNLLWNGTSAIYAPSTQDINSAFSIPFNGKPFGIPANNADLGSGGIVSYAHVWIAPGVYLPATDVTKFRDAGGHPVDLGANGQIPTGTSPRYFFTGDATTFATNMGTGGAVTLVGSMTSVTGPS